MNNRSHVGMKPVLSSLWANGFLGAAMLTCDIA